MRKIVVITGEPSSGKSRLSEFIRLGYDNPVLVDGAGFRKGQKMECFFNAVTSNTDLIVVDELPAEHLKEFIYLSTDSLTVSKQGVDGFQMVCPKIVLILNGYPKIDDVDFISFKRRVTLLKTAIETDENGNTFKITKSKFI